MKVIGAIGQNGSGKDAVTKHLGTKYGLPLLSTGDIVRDIAAKEGLEPSRTSLQQISDRYFRQFGEGCFVKMIVDRLTHSDWPVAAITGIRSPEDVAILRDAFGDDFLLIHVHVTDARDRYERMCKRGEGRDQNTYDEFARQDQAEETLFHLSQAASLADCSLRNDGTLEDLHRALDRLLDGCDWL
ncbi:MAG: AAA family ATPase [Chloroflexota bacterium]|nr:AAA family ATPase [Chloroflexota bacterium]